jgi:hypothetical protein
MEIGKTQLLNKFPFLKKFENSDVIKQLSLTQEMTYDDLYFNLSILLIEDLKDFIERTKFTSRWEEGFSIKIRLNQILDLIRYVKHRNTIEQSLTHHHHLHQDTATEH